MFFYLQSNVFNIYALIALFAELNVDSGGLDLETIIAQWLLIVQFTVSTEWRR